MNKTEYNKATEYALALHNIDTVIFDYNLSYTEVEYLNTAKKCIHEACNLNLKDIDLWNNFIKHNGVLNHLNTTYLLAAFEYFNVGSYDEFAEEFDIAVICQTYKDFIKYDLIDCNESLTIKEFILKGFIVELITDIKDGNSLYSIKYKAQLDYLMASEDFDLGNLTEEMCISRAVFEAANDFLEDAFVHYANEFFSDF